MDLGRVQTNTVMFELTDPAWTSTRFVAALTEEGVRIGSRGEWRCRAMTHHAITERDVEIVLDRARRLLSDRG